MTYHGIYINVEGPTEAIASHTRAFINKLQQLGNVTHASIVHNSKIVLDTIVDTSKEAASNAGEALGEGISNIQVGS